MSTLPYRFASEPGTYTCQATKRQTLRQSHGETVPHWTAADTTFNWAVRRGDLLLVSGDFPRFAFLTRRRVARNDPPPLKIGDARLKLTTAGGSFRWEDASSITATFHPTHVEHLVSWAELPGVVGRLRVGLMGGSEAAALATVEAAPGASFSGCLELDFGGISTHGRTFSGAYFPPDSPDDPRTAFTISEDGGVLTCPDYPERIAVRFGGSPQLDAVGGRLRASWPVSLAGAGHFAAGSTWRLSSGSSDQWPPDPSAVAVAFSRMEASDAAFLAESVATTPDPYIGPGVAAAVLTLENCWDFSAWLESTHWWSCYWTNNYQISAAVALGQWDRARRALDFFLDDQGDCPARLADGSRMGDGIRVGRYDALPFWLHQLAAYVDATGDVEFVRRRRPQVEKCIASLLTARESEPGGLLNWFTGVNCTVYQADHLGWPGEATSPSFLAALALRDWGHLCETAGDPGAAGSWTEKADHLERLARARLWDDERGCFFSHRDDEGHVFRNHYYSDHVYPVLYGKILTPPEQVSVLGFLRRELTFETPSARLLMRVGTYLPSIFSNDNVMPTQMAEAAMAFERLGDNETAARFLHAVGLAATLDTESPGSFPERLLDNGQGEANYGFGNPSGAYATAVVNGLFGVALREGGEACEWTPAFPDAWPSAQLHLPWVDLGYSQTTATDGRITRTFKYSAAQARRLQFRVFLPLASAYHVRVDQREAQSLQARGRGGSWLSLSEYATQESAIEISFTPHPVKVTGPDVATVGIPASRPLSSRRVTLDDPAAGRASQAEPVCLDGLPQASTMHVTFPWRHSPKFDLHLRAHAEKGFASDGERFPVRGDQDSFCLVDGGISDQVTMRGPVPSAVPKILVIPVNRLVSAVSMLFASEMEMRLCDAQVGEIRFTYAGGQDDVVPLVAGRNFDALRGYSAPECSPIPLNGEGDHLNVLRLPCATTRTLDQITITMQQRDARLALIALHTFAVQG